MLICLVNSVKKLILLLIYVILILYSSSAQSWTAFLVYLGAWVGSGAYVNRSGNAWLIYAVVGRGRTSWIAVAYGGSRWVIWGNVSFLVRRWLILHRGAKFGAGLQRNLRWWSLFKVWVVLRRLLARAVVVWVLLVRMKHRGVRKGPRRQWIKLMGVEPSTSMTAQFRHKRLLCNLNRGWLILGPCSLPLLVLLWLLHNLWISCLCKICLWWGVVVDGAHVVPLGSKRLWVDASTGTSCIFIASSSWFDTMSSSVSLHHGVISQLRGTTLGVGHRTKIPRTYLWCRLLGMHIICQWFSLQVQESPLLRVCWEDMLLACLYSPQLHRIWCRFLSASAYAWAAISAFIVVIILVNSTPSNRDLRQLWELLRTHLTPWPCMRIDGRGRLKTIATVSGRSLTSHQAAASFVIVLIYFEWTFQKSQCRRNYTWLFTSVLIWATSMSEWGTEASRC